MAWRAANKRSRSPLLIRPAIFVTMRLATFIIRALQATAATPSIGLYIAEQVLLLAGFVLICEPLLALLKYHIKRNYKPEVALQSRRDPLNVAIKIADLALIAALVLGSVTASQFSNVYDAQGNVNENTVSVIKRMRDANAALCIVATVGSILIVVKSTLQDSSLPRNGMVFISLVGMALTIVSVYKLVFYSHTPPPSPLSKNMKALFYIFCSLPELVATAAFFIVDLESIFQIRQARINIKIEKLIKKGKPVPEELFERRERARQGASTSETHWTQRRHQEESLVEMQKQ
ncbi:hypothetical protein ACM66B_001700 [Microbotryomycetes sp. NB124-2]